MKRPTHFAPAEAMHSRNCSILAILCFALFSTEPLFGQNSGGLSLVTNVEYQPFVAQVKNLIDATDYLGSPFSAAEKQAIDAACKESDRSIATDKLQQILDGHCLFGVEINPEMRVKVAAGPAKPVLIEQGWRQFLVKVHNESGTTASLRASSPQARRLHNSPAEEVQDRWLDLATFDQQPLKKTLGGLNLEYRIVQLYSRDAGKRDAKISFNVGQGTQDLGFRGEVDVLFTALPAREVAFRVLDEENHPTTASFLIRDAQDRVYPSQAKRLAPDFAFHPQIYRHDGETLKLPVGTYTVEVSRGPESVMKRQTIAITDKTKSLSFKTERWIDPSKLGWWSGDHHIHAAGCAHYTKPSEGVHADDMIRHCIGEDLKVGANRTWGPSFDYQKQFFCGAVDKVSQYPYLLRYDIEVSGFGSHQSGHLCLLRLREQMYPGGDSKNHWPTLGLNTLRWAKKQGAVTGPAHSGWGLEIEGRELPSYQVPKFDGIGANEYIVDVTHELPGPDGRPLPAVDFLSMVDTPCTWELNMWYHTLNAGFRTRISGETDFPCIYGEKVGLGRSYVKLDGKLDYDQWCEGIRRGRNYVSDGKTHLFDFKVDGQAMGENGSELKLPKAGSVRVSARVAALLNEKANPALQNRPYKDKPYWDVERSRIGDTREVPVEVIVNGYSVARKNIVADGKIRDINFDVKVDRSSWVALRILPSSHTNPVFVLVDGKPVRSSRRSVEWCLKGVEQCWSQKERFINAKEMEEARNAYAHARTVYQKLLGECEAE
jgi:hypothetical protein